MKINVRVDYRFGHELISSLMTAVTQEVKKHRAKGIWDFRAECKTFINICKGLGKLFCCSIEPAVAFVC